MTCVSLDALVKHLIRANWELFIKVWLPREQDKGELAKRAPPVGKEIT